MSFKRALDDLYALAWEFSPITVDDIERYIDKEQNSDDHPLSVASRKAIEREGIFLTNNLSDLGDSVAKIGQQKIAGGASLGGCYLAGERKMYVNTTDPSCIPNVYAHELTHHFDYVLHQLEKCIFFLQARLGLLKEDQIKYHVASDEFVALAVAHIIGNEYGVDSSLITRHAAMQNMMMSPSAAADFTIGKFNDRIEQSYTALQEALA